MTREEFYKLTDILNSEVLGSFMHGGEADELIAMFEEAVDHSNILEQEKPISEDFLSLVDKEARELWKEINSGNDFSIVDSFNQFYGICMQVAESTVEWQKNLQEPVNEDYDNALHSEALTFLQEQQIAPNLYADIIIRAVKHGAKWQEEQDQETIELAEDHAMLAGMEKMKEHLMAKAIDAQCFGFQGDALFSFRLPADNYLIGSEVKVIIIKED